MEGDDRPARWCRALVNTTTLGMVGQPPLEINLRCPAIAGGGDLVYAPLVTGLLASARERGLRTADGLGMLLHQAVRGFELWFGIRPEVTRNCARWSKPICSRKRDGCRRRNKSPDLGFSA